MQVVMFLGSIGNDRGKTRTEHSKGAERERTTLEKKCNAKKMDATYSPALLCLRKLKIGVVRL